MKTWLGIFISSLVLATGWAAADNSDAVFDPNVTAKAIAGGSSNSAPPRTWFPTPVLVVTPATLDFGRVLTNTTVTNTFLVENVGRGRVIGKATVSAPFKVVEGGSYSLTRNEKQVVTVSYAPRNYSGSNDVRTISFTGAGVADATVTGTPVKSRAQ